MRAIYRCCSFSLSLAFTLFATATAPVGDCCCFALIVCGYWPLVQWQNPPPSLLEAEIAKNTDFALTLARCLPRVRVLSSSSTPLGGGFSKLSIALRNDGYLPTYGTSQALTTASVRKAPKASLVLSGDVALVNGEARPVLPHLAGRSRHSFASGYSVSSGPNTEEHR